MMSLLFGFWCSVQPARGQEIELAYTDQFGLLWNDVGSGGDLDGSFFAPSVPAGSDFRALGHNAVGPSGYAAPFSAIVAKMVDPAGDALVHPMAFQQIWTDSGSGADRDGAVYKPIPPFGYVSLGWVAADNGSGQPPALDSVWCVREDLVLPATVGDLIYDTRGTFATGDFSAWEIIAPKGAIDLKAWIGGGVEVGTLPGPLSKPQRPVWCLKASAVVPLDPSQAEIQTAIETFGPILRFHPDENFLPDDPAAMIDDPGTTLQWVTIPPSAGDAKVDHDNFVKTELGWAPTSSSTILDDVQSALADPLSEDSEFRYLVNYPNYLAGGDLSRSEAYVRVQPVNGVITELQFWIFYPWNGAGKSRMTVGEALEEEFNPSGTMGRHYSDWEVISVRVTNKNLWGTPGDYELSSVILSRHSFEDEVWNAEPRLQKVGTHPVVYSAKDSHAQYPSAGRHYYERAKELDFVFGTFAIDLFDEAGDGLELATYQAGKHTIISSAWPDIVTSPPDWVFYGGIWGDYLLNTFTVTIEDVIFGEIYTEYQREVNNGKPGVLRRALWDVLCPANPLLGSLRTSVGTLSPAFSPQTLAYSLTVPSGEDFMISTVPAAHAALVEFSVNGGAYSPMPSGVVLGKQSDPLPLTKGDNEVLIRVTTPPSPGCTPVVSTTTLSIYKEYSLGESLDAEVFNWTTGGSGSDWFAQTDVTHDGIYAARSGEVAPGQVSFTETTVTGPATLGFWWKLTGTGSLTLDLDGSPAKSIVGEQDWAFATMVIPSGSHTLRWSYTKGTSTAGPDAGWLDEVTVLEGDLVVEQPVGNPLLDGISEVSFGSQAPNTGSVPRLFTVTNLGTAPVTISDISMVTGLPFSFAVDTSGLPGAIPAGGSGTFTVVFYSDTVVGQLDGSMVRITSDSAGQETFDIPVSGSSIEANEMDLTDASGAPLYGGISEIEFGGLLTGSGSSARTLTITNDGSLPLALTSLSIVGSNSGDFVLDATGVPSSLAVGGQATFTVTFSPLGDGLRGAVLQILSDDLDEGTTLIDLIGTGLRQPEIGIEHPPGSPLFISGAATAWGGNNFGETNVPVLPEGLKAIAAGDIHGLGLKHDGTVVGWGGNFSGQADVPAGLSGVVEIAAGGGHSIALKDDGTMVTWGSSDNGLGNVPVDLAGVVGISAGLGHTVVVKSDGTVVAWGRDDLGQATVPPGLAGVVAVAAGDLHSVALKSDGTVVAWGYNFNNQTDVPPGLGPVIAIAADGQRTMVLKADGTVVAWGLYTTGFYAVPAGLFDVTAIALGGDHSLALKSDGSIVIWGGTTGGKAVIPLGLGPVTAIAGGSTYSLVLVASPAVDFGSLTVTGVSAPQTVTIRNTGNDALAINSITLTGGDVAEFSLDLTGTLSSVPPGGQTTFAATFSPTSPGTRKATVRVANNDLDESAFDLELTGLSIDGSPEIVIERNPGIPLVSGVSIVDFGARGVGKPGGAIPFTIKNIGIGALNITGVTTTGGNPGDFTVDTTGMLTSVPVGGETTFSVSFTPGALGSRGTTLRLLNNDTDEADFDISLIGTGILVPEIVIEQPPGISLANGTSNVPFPDQATTLPGEPVSFTIRNTGGQTLGITGVSTVSGNAADFLVNTGGMLASVPAGGQTSFAVVFAPSAPGARVTVLRVLSNDPDAGSFEITLSGTGYAPELVIEGPSGMPLPGAFPLTAWGSDADGESTVPLELSNIAGIAAGKSHSLALKNDGTVVAWGLNSSNQTSVPAGLNGVIAIAAGGEHSLALKSDGTVVGWGLDTSNQATVPPGLNNVIAIAAGNIHSLALKSDGTVETWGYSGGGILAVPVGLSGVTAIAGGVAHSVALKDDGTVVAWGSNTNGQRNLPAGLNDVIAIAAGDNHTVALKSNGTVVATNSFNLPIPAGLNGVTAITAGLLHTTALKNDGTVVAWGLGDFAVPAGLGGVDLIAAGGNHTFAYSGALDQPVDLGSRQVGAPGVAETITIRNTGGGPVTITSVSTVAGDIGDFVIDTSAMLTSIPSGQETSFTLTFNPTVVGSRSMAMRVVSNDADQGVFDIAVTGTGVIVPELVLEYPAGTPLVSGVDSVSLGSGNVGVTSAVVAITIKNTGPVPLSISEVRLEGLEGGDFGLDTSGMLTSVPAGGQTTVGVTFTPIDSGLRVTNLLVFSDGSDSGVSSISLTGTGVGVSEISVEYPVGVPLVSGVSSVDFGSQRALSAGTPRSFTVRNSGQDSLTISDVVTTGGDSSEFIVDTAGMLSLVPPGQETTFTVTFHPQLPGARATVLEVLNNDVDESTFAISLTGTGSRVVTTLADSGAGSLRDTIAAALPGESVFFDDPLDGGTITLAGTEILIGKDLIIDATSLPGGITVSGDVTGDGATPDDSRVFNVSNGSSVELIGLTISGGYSPSNGGGIYCINANLDLTRCVLSGNTANQGGGLYSSGSSVVVGINECLVIGNIATSNGAGVFNSLGQAIVSASTFRANTSTTGGGAGFFDQYSAAGSSVVGSTFVANSAVFGAALYCRDGDFEITNCTVWNNTATTNAGGGLYTQNCNATITHSTFVANSAGGFGGGGLLLGSGSLTLANSVVAGNTSPAGPTGADIRKLSVTLTALGRNLIGDNTSVVAEFPEDGVLVGGNTLPLVDPLLAPLGDYGQPIESRPPLPGSPCIEGAILIPSTPLTDQLGSLRPSGPLPDLGAVEAVPLNRGGLVDTDDDGIDDRLEAAYPQLTVGVNDRLLDSDGDGSPDVEELANMTDLNDPNDRFRVSSFTKAAGFDPESNRVFSVTIATFPGLEYELEMDSGLTDFQPIPGSIFIADGFSKTLEVPFTQSRSFVRAKRN